MQTHVHGKALLMWSSYGVHALIFVYFYCGNKLLSML